MDGSTPVYSIPSTGSTTPFSINQLTAVISVVQNIDYETETIYQFSILATDSAESSATTSVTVYVNDVSNNRPVFDESEYSIVLFQDQLLVLVHVLPLV